MARSLLLAASCVAAYQLAGKSTSLGHTAQSSSGCGLQRSAALQEAAKIVLASAIPNVAALASDFSTVKLETSEGDIVIELRPDWAPLGGSYSQAHKDVI